MVEDGLMHRSGGGCWLSAHPFLSSTIVLVSSHGGSILRVQALMTSTFQASDCSIFTNVLLTKASHVAKAGVSVKGDHTRMGIQASRT